MGTLCDAAYSRRLALQWQIVLSLGLSCADSVRAVFARFRSISNIFRGFSLSGRKGGPDTAVVYARIFTVVPGERHFRFDVSLTRLSASA